MKVLIVGSGGREHALAWKARQSKGLETLYVAPGNPGTAEVAENVPIEATDLDGLARFATRNAVGLTVIGPDDPLARGMADRFRSEGLTIFGPSKSAARIEASKVFAKRAMKSAGVPTAEFEAFGDFRAAREYLKRQPFPLFIKADGLAQGKGAIFASSLAEGELVLSNIMQKGAFGEAGSSVIIESYLDGPEVSLHALCNETAYLMFPVSQDHKPVFDGNRGPNTGGMGTVGPVSTPKGFGPDVLGRLVVAPILSELAGASTPFSGLLYPGVKLTSHGPRVVEYNARFGDPEAQVYMRLLRSDLIEMLQACIGGDLQSYKAEWLSDTFAVNVAITSAGYPGSYQKNIPITGVDEASDMDDVVIFHAGTAVLGDRLVTNGGRVLYVSATGKSITEARSKAYRAVNAISFEGMHFRSDIGYGATELEEGETIG
jgi:phosphoribosylamine---glycine ligase